MLNLNVLKRGHKQGPKQGPKQEVRFVPNKAETVLNVSQSRTNISYELYNNNNNNKESPIASSFLSRFISMLKPLLKISFKEIGNKLQFTPLKIDNGTPEGRVNRDLRETLPINALESNPPMEGNNNKSIYLKLIDIRNANSDGHKFISWNSTGDIISSWKSTGIPSISLYPTNSKILNIPFQNVTEGEDIGSKWNPSINFNEIAFIVDKYRMYIYNYTQKTLTHFTFKNLISSFCWSPDGCSISIVLGLTRKYKIIILEIKRLEDNKKTLSNSQNATSAEKFKYFIINKANTSCTESNSNNYNLSIGYYNMDIKIETNDELNILQQTNNISKPTYDFTIKYAKEYNFNYPFSGLEIYWGNHNIILFNRYHVLQMPIDLEYIKTFVLNINYSAIDIIESKSDIKIVIGNASGYIQLYNIPFLKPDNPNNGKRNTLINHKMYLYAKIHAHSNLIKSIKFSPNSSLIATTGASKIKIWKIESKNLKEVISIYVGTNLYPSICFNPIHNYIAYIIEFKIYILKLVNEKNILKKNKFQFINS